jgi:hypothetical protein
VNQPYDWSRSTRSKGKASMMRREENCDHGRSRITQRLLDATRQPVAVIGNPPPLRTFAKRQGALFLRALPLSRARK